MTTRKLRSTLWLALIALLIAAPLWASGKSNKWRIEFSEGAKSDGEIRFVVTPARGEPFEIVAAIADGTSENRVARRVSEAFKAALPKDRFHVEVDDGEDVLVKHRGGEPDFQLALVSSTVKAVRIHVEKE
jgi:hypothetical protein